MSISCSSLALSPPPPSPSPPPSLPPSPPPPSPHTLTLSFYRSSVWHGQLSFAKARTVCANKNNVQVARSLPRKLADVPRLPNDVVFLCPKDAPSTSPTMNDQLQLEAAMLRFGPIRNIIIDTEMRRSISPSPLTPYSLSLSPSPLPPYSLSLFLSFSLSLFLSLFLSLSLPLSNCLFLSRAPLPLSLFRTPSVLFSPSCTLLLSLSPTLSTTQCYRDVC